jgi:hypothetical protein
MEYTIELSNGLDGDDRASFVLAVARNGEIINKNPLDTTGPITILGFALPAEGLARDRDRKTFISWADFDAADGSTDVLGYRIVQKRDDGHEEVSGFGILAVGSDF